MTYQEIQAQLKTLKSQGAIVPPLNSSKAVLENALAELQALTIEVVIGSTKKPLEITETVATVELAVPQTTTIEAPVEITPAAIVEPTIESVTGEVIPQWITPQHPAITEVKELARVAEIALVWSIALVRSLLRFSKPHLLKAGEIALKIAVWTAVLFEVWIYPKLQLVGYRLALWAILTAIKVRNSRKTAIA